MAATYLDIYNRRMSTHEPFLARIEVAVAKFAIYCRNASINAEWWPEAIADPAAKARAMAWEVCFDPAIADAESTAGLADSVIQAAVESVALRY